MSEAKNTVKQVIDSLANRSAKLGTAGGHHD